MRIVVVSASLIAAAAIWVMPVAGARGAEPPSPGALLFEHRCARCHGIAADGGDGLAPPLTGVVGSNIASRKDYLYTAGLKAKVGVWNPALLDQYLADPQAFAPGADMDVNSPDPDERASIIEYLKTLK